MNKNVVIGTTVLIALVVSIGLYISSVKSNSLKKAMVEEKSVDAMVKPTEVAMKQKSQEVMMKKERGTYVKYENTQTLEDKNSKLVLFFFANWCPTCIPADKEFESNSAKIPDGVKLVRVNYNDPDTDSNEKELATKYAIIYQHTFVQIDSSGSVVTKWNGGGIDELISNIK